MPSAVPSMNRIHITDIYFHNELIMMIGKPAGDKWLDSVISARKASCKRSGKSASPSGSNAQLSPTTSQPSSPLRYYHGSRITLDEDDSDTQQQQQQQQLRDRPVLEKSQCAAESFTLKKCPSQIYCNLSIDDDDCPNNIGLLFTDCAHTVLNGNVTTKGLLGFD